MGEVGLGGVFWLGEGVISSGVGCGRMLGLGGCWFWVDVGFGRMLVLGGCWFGRVVGLEGGWFLGGDGLEGGWVWGVLGGRRMGGIMEEWWWQDMDFSRVVDWRRLTFCVLACHGSCTC